MRRKSLMGMLLVALFALYAGNAALAQSWPSKPIKWIVPYTTGGASDFLARMLGQKLSERLGQPVVVENRPGAGGNLGTDLLAKAPPDGYTIGLGNIGPIAVNRSLYPNLPYDSERDLAPITLLATYPSLILANPDFPAKSIKELIALAKQRDKAVSYGSTGMGTSQHLTGELFAMTAGIRMLHVPYKGSMPGLTDAMAGHVPLMIDPLANTAINLIKSGKLRALAVTSSERTPQLPDVPTVAESGLPDFVVTGWIGVLAPKGVPPEVMKRLVDEFDAVLRMPDVKEKLAETGAHLPTFGPEYFAKFIRSETQRWEKVVQAANIKLQ